MVNRSSLNCGWHLGQSSQHTTVACLSAQRRLYTFMHLHLHLMTGCQLVRFKIEIRGMRWRPTHEHAAEVEHMSFTADTLKQWERRVALHQYPTCGRCAQPTWARTAEGAHYVAARIRHPVETTTPAHLQKRVAPARQLYGGHLATRAAVVHTSCPSYVAADVASLRYDHAYEQLSS